jgi:VWFA-related protein
MTAFFDAIVVAAGMLRGKATPYSRRVVVSLSDGEDNNSESRFDEALRGLLHADCIFYAIDPAGPSVQLNRLSEQGLETMRSLAAATGGAVFVPASPSDLNVIFSRISAELRAQYLLCYYSSSQGTGGSFRRIVVTVPGRPDLSIHARQGYYAPPS